MIIIVWIAGGDLEAVKPKGLFNQWCKRLRYAWGLDSIPWQGDGVPEWAHTPLAQQRSLFPWRILNYVLDQTGRGKTNKQNMHKDTHQKSTLAWKLLVFFIPGVLINKKSSHNLGEGNESSWRFKELWKKRSTCALLFGWNISLMLS